MTLREHTSRLRIGLGTFVAVDAEASALLTAQLGIAAAFDAVTQVETLMHPTRAGSDLAALHACPQGVALRIHAWTWEVLDICQHLHRLSHGVFDPCLPESTARITDLELTESRSVVPHAPVSIDLGGIAKGYAADRALDALRASGCEGGLVNVGGDLAVFGACSHEIICRGRRGGNAIVELRNAALATSDAGHESRPAEHRGYYHGADRGAVVSGRVTIMAASAAVADALTKCLLIGDRVLNQRLLDAFGAQQIDDGESGAILQ
jgi:FAD:protein FMN transferase